MLKLSNNRLGLLLMTLIALIGGALSRSVVCEGDIFKNNGNCINNQGTASDPLDEYTCNGNNNQCYCGYTKQCTCKNNNGNFQN